MTLQLDTQALTAGIDGQPEFERRIRGRGKKQRFVYDPNVAARTAHDRLLTLLRTESGQNPHATAGRHSSPLRNAERHRHHRHFVCHDLKKAYESTQGSWLAEYFTGADEQLSLMDEEVVRFLEQYCLMPGGNGLWTGAPASQDIFNQVGRMRIDFDLARFCQRWDITYTRYFDDLTFSSNRVIGKRLQKALREIILRSGFELATDKSRVVDLYRSRFVVVTGVTIAYGGSRLFMPRRKLGKIRNVLRYELVHGGVKPEVLAGNIGYFRSIHPRDSDLNATEQRVNRLCREVVRRSPVILAIRFRRPQSGLLAGLQTAGAPGV